MGVYRLCGPLFFPPLPHVVLFAAAPQDRTMALELEFLLVLSGKGRRAASVRRGLGSVVAHERPPQHHDCFRFEFPRVGRAFQVEQVLLQERARHGRGHQGALALGELGFAPRLWISCPSKDGVMHEVVQGLPRFCRTTVQRNGNDEEPYGAEALGHLVSVMVESKDAGTLDLDSVTPFVVYRWILPPALKGSVDAMVAEAVKAYAASPWKKQQQVAIKDEVAHIFATAERG